MDDMTALRSRLEQRSSDFSPAEARLASDLLEHPDEWGYLASTQLATRLKVHRSTIVRFAQSAGYKGFPELQAAARASYLHSMSSAPELVLMDSHDGGGALVGDIFQRELANLQQSYLNLSVTALEETARAIAGARRVLIFGRRFSYPIALYLSLALRAMRSNVELAPEQGGTSIDQLFDLGEDDYALVVSMRRYSQEVQRVLRYLSGRAVPHTLLTDTSPANDFPASARVLRAHIGGAGVLDSYTAFTSVGHALLSLVATALPEAEARLAEAESLWRRFSKD
ncbi:MAG TPA: MurR/RpiR family transcriptional regulator [Trueperaceae bacterium]|nr:MurR/RpiR family transcriptional regulator [Trueperaceae bacterium]